MIHNRVLIGVSINNLNEKIGKFSGRSHFKICPLSFNFPQVAFPKEALPQAYKLEIMTIKQL